MTQSIFRNKDYKWTTKLFLISIWALYYSSRFLGIICFTFDVKRFLIKESWYARFYSGFLLVTIFAFMTFAMHVLYTEMIFLRQNELLTYVGYSRYAIILLCAMATLFIQLYSRRSIIHCINRLLKSCHILEININAHINGMIF